MHDFIRYRRVEFRLFVVLAALCVLLSLTTDTFLTFGNLSSLLNNNSVTLIWAVGLLVFTAITTPLWAPGQPAALMAAIGVLGGLAMAGTVAALTGWALVRLLRPPAR